eukprot:5456556-Pleurochrysis_carterae.AAC.3
MSGRAATGILRRQVEGEAAPQDACKHVLRRELARAHCRVPLRLQLVALEGQRHRQRLRAHAGSGSGDEGSARRSAHVGRLQLRREVGALQPRS